MATDRSARTSLPASFRWLLVASLALNLLVVGLLIGSVLSHGGAGRGPRAMEMTLGPIARALEAEDRHAILHDLHDRPDLRSPDREERGAAFAEIVAAIRSEPFDRARAREAISHQAARVAGVEEAVREALVERLAVMAPTERAAFAGRLEAEIEKGPGR